MSSQGLALQRLRPGEGPELDAEGDDVFPNSDDDRNEDVHADHSLLDRLAQHPLKTLSRADRRKLVADMNINELRVDQPLCCLSRSRKLRRSRKLTEAEVH